MGDNTTTYGQIEARVGIKAVARLLSVGQPLLLTQRFGSTEVIGLRQGDTIKWRRYHLFTVTKAPLAEGVPPAVIPLRKTDYTAVLRQYGAVAELTDKCVDLHEDNVLDVAIKNHGILMAQTIEALTIDVIKAGTTVFYAGGSTITARTSVVAAPSRSDFRRIARFFDRNDAKEISRVISPSAKVSTAGVRPAFFALGSTDLEPDLLNMTGFREVVAYADPGEALPGEVGSVDRFRFCLSRLFEPWLLGGGNSTTMLSNGDAPSGTVAVDVYPIICLAKDAYGVVRLQGKDSAQIKVLQPGEPRGGDPLGQKGTVGFKIWFAAAILCEERIARLECACTANPS